MPRLIIDDIKKRSLINFYWKQGQKVLFAIQQPVIDLAGNIDPETLKYQIPHLLKEGQIYDYLSNLWIRGGSLFAVDMMQKIEKIRKKQEPNYDYWEDFFRRYQRERSAFKAGEIISAQTKIVNDIIDRNIEEGRLGGLGIPEMARYLKTDLIDSLTEINTYQAERIARTEMNGASNAGSFEGAKESGVALGKGWLTSGLPGVRPSHQEYEDMGTQEMDYEYNTGLQYPGDPDGDPEEIINCRCTIVFEVD